MKFDELKELLAADRSIRRFDASVRASESDLERLVGLTRYCASGRNLQPLRYRIVTDPEECRALYPCLKWAGYLPEWDGPVPEERPVAYLVQCLDTRLATSCLCDDGLHLQTITLGATAMGLGACIIKSFDIPQTRAILEIPDRYAPIYVLALGVPIEKVVIEDTDGSTDADIKYYRTPDGVHHVPKRPFSELLI